MCIVKFAFNFTNYLFGFFTLWWFRKLNKKIFWVGCMPPNDRSIGDHAQTLAVSKILKKFFSDYEIKRFYRTELNDFFNSNINTEDLIFIHSSGDFGDLHYVWHDIRKKIISSFPSNKIIQLPISTCYTNISYLNNDGKFFSDKKNLIILCRSKKDVEILKLFFNCKVLFFPDFAFYIQPQFLSENRNGKLLALRYDKESLIKSKPPKIFMRRYIRNITNPILKFNFDRKIRKEYKDYYIKDTQIYDYDITDMNREKVIQETLHFISKFESVVTDRFHVRVFAYLTNTPCKTVKSLISEKTESEFEDYREYFKCFRDVVYG